MNWLVWTLWLVCGEAPCCDALWVLIPWLDHNAPQCTHDPLSILGPLKVADDHCRPRSITPAILEMLRPRHPASTLAHTHITQILTLVHFSSLQTSLAMRTRCSLVVWYSPPTDRRHCNEKVGVIYLTVSGSNLMADQCSNIFIKCWTEFSRCCHFM